MKIQVSLHKPVVTNFIWLKAVMLLLGYTMAGCDKDEPGGAPGDDTTKYLLKKVDYTTFGAAAFYYYNPDSTTRQIVYRGSTGTADTLHLEYLGKKIRRSFLSNSLYKTIYHYNINGKISSQFQEFNGEGRGLRFDYTYNPDGYVAQMKYYNVNEAGDQLVYTNTYEYDQQSVLKKIRSFSGNTVINFSIDSYSPECDFNPWTFIGVSSLGEVYSIYNYPVLLSLKRLPQKITKLVSVNGGPAIVNQLYEASFVIAGKKIEKATSSVKYPLQQGSDSQSESIFSYY